MDLRTRLAHATRPAHEALERELALDGTISLDRYAWYLRTMHAFVMPVEEVLRGDPRLDALGLGLARRCKAQWLESDLAHLGIAPVDAPPPEMPQELPARVGWAYVIEGSTLGGRVLLRSLAPRLSLDAERGARFLAGYGEATGAMWREFVAALNALPFSAAEVQACAAGATQAFEAIGMLLRDQSPARALTSAGSAGLPRTARPARPRTAR